MNTTGLPKKQPVPFGVNGQREDLLSTTPAGDNTASYDAGFPPVTMILKAAGGLPPKGQDMNQILFELSAIARWLNAGASYPFDVTFASAVGGYPKGAVIPNSTGTGYWLNQTENNSSSPEAAATVNTGWVPVDQYGTTAITGLAASSVTLTTLQAAKSRLTLTGTLTDNISVIFPAWINTWTVVNNCTGAFSVTCKTPSGTGVAIPTGLTASISGDGTNITQDTNILGFSGRLLNVQVFNAAGQYTPTPGMKFILSHMIGGGGASGGTPATASNQTGGSAAGNSGGYAFIRAYAIDIGAGKAINIGAGGTTQVNSSGFAGGTTSIADIAEVTGGYGSNPGSVSATTAVAQPSYGKPVVNKYNKTEILISSLGSQASNFLQSATGSGTGWISPLSTFPGGEKGRGGSGVFVNASTAAQPGLPGNSGAILIMEYA